MFQDVSGVSGFASLEQDAFLHRPTVLPATRLVAAAEGLPIDCCRALLGAPRRVRGQLCFVLLKTCTAAAAVLWRRNTWDDYGGLDGVG